MRDPLWGILCGSIAAAFFDSLRPWLSEQAGLLTSLTVQRPALRNPIAVVMLTLLALLLPRFYKKSKCLINSWRVGLIRVNTILWALASFFYWLERNYLPLFITSAVVLEILLDLKDPTRQKIAYSADEISGWIPRRQRSDISEIAFDKPIENWKQDAIGRQEFVQTLLSRVLVDAEPAIGICAEFGEGKSSVLHLIEDCIEQGRKAIAVPFRTWLPGSEETFLDSLFATAAASIREKYFLPSWRPTLKSYGRVVLGVIPKSWGFLGDLLPSDSQVTQIKELTAFFSRLPVRVVFLLDEIDRMHQEELAVLFKILRGAPELTNISYVCAFNREALARIISPRDRKFGVRYLEKFFPVQLQLPRIDADLRERLFAIRVMSVLDSEGMQWSDDTRKQFEDARNSLWYDALQNRLRNFRSMGQVLRAFHTSLHVLKSEINVFDLMVIESVRCLLPDTYEFIYQNGRYFHEPPAGIERWNRTQFFGIDNEARKRAVTEALEGYFSRLAVEDRELSRALLSPIFPSVKEYFREKDSGRGPVTAEFSKDERRISNFSFFSRYFEYAVPETMFGEEEMNDFLSAIRKGDQQEISAVLHKTFPGAGRDDLRRIHFLRRLRGRAAEIPPKAATFLAIELAKLTSEMSSDHVAYQVIMDLVLALAAHFQGTEDLQKFIDGVIENAGSDRFASDIVSSTVSAQNTVDQITNWRGFDPNRTKEAFGTRMRAHHVRPVSRLLPIDTDDLQAFIRWRLYVPTDIPYVADYFRSAFEFDIRNVGIFLQWLLPGNIIYEGGPIKFIESFYSPISDIVMRLKSADKENVRWEPEQKAAIHRFWDFLDRESGQGTTPKE